MADHSDGLDLRRLDQRREADTERITDSQQRSDARVRLALLDIDHHAPADTGSLRQTVERPPPGLPLLSDSLADRMSQGRRVLIRECIIVHSECSLSSHREQNFLRELFG